MSVDDTDGPQIKNSYDVGGRLIQKQRTDGTTTHNAKYSYDQRDRVVSEINFAGEKTDYRYDVIGVGCLIQDQPTSITRPDGKTTTQIGG